VNFGYRFICPTKNIVYLSEWGFDSFKEAKKKLENLANIFITSEKDTATGEIFDKEKNIKYNFI